MCVCEREKEREHINCLSVRVYVQEMHVFQLNMVNVHNVKCEEFGLIQIIRLHVMHVRITLRRAHICRAESHTVSAAQLHRVAAAASFKY